jgi:hypothetical protein
LGGFCHFWSDAMGPTCEIVLPDNAEEAMLEAIDAYLARVIEDFCRTRKRRSWSGWIGSRPVDIWVEDAGDGEPAAIGFAAGCNSPEDYAMLLSVSKAIAQLVRGIATEPVK